MALYFTLAAMVLSSETAREYIQDLMADLTVIFADNSLVIVCLTGIASILCLAFSLFSCMKGNRKTQAFSLGAEKNCFEGADASQIAMMEEECILLDDFDKVVGHESKKNCHLNSSIFGEKNLLHRAFSVFLFNSKGELLMQQRSAEKITFPHYWANSCCSHPLFRQDEIDGIDGAKRAARRKIEQELGISPGLLPMDSFHFLTKIHYKARSNDIWGEHEIDYIFFCMPPADVLPKPNPNEVAATRYFSKNALDEFVRKSDENGDLVSPWFRVIHSNHLSPWWDAMLQGDLASVVEDPTSIHRWGLAGNTTKEFSTLSRGIKKQGAYGKIKIHQHSIWNQLLHADEMMALVKLMLQGGMTSAEQKLVGNEDVEFAAEMLEKTSRSFAAVTLQLPEELRLAICVFYLTLRALDTVEDDMTSFPVLDVKLKLLRGFYEKLEDPAFFVNGVGEGEEKRLLENFGRIVKVYASLPENYRSVISDITKRMGEGMAIYIQRDMTQGTATLGEYNEYCYYVAGLVGEGLSSIFSFSKLEDPAVANRKRLSHSMGLFLQKVNIIRDYLEDFVDGRSFWPASVWKKHAEGLGDFADSANIKPALCCLNEMIADALGHTPDCLEYLRQLKDPSIFRFCAIPQIMAIATLSEIYANPKVFSGVVKIRKGLACKLMLDTTNITDVESAFLKMTRSIVSRADPREASTKSIRHNAQELEQIVCSQPPSTPRLLPAKVQTFLNVLAPSGFIVLLAYFFQRQKGRESRLPQLTETADVVALALMFVVIGYMFGFLGVRVALSQIRSQTQKSV